MIGSLQPLGNDSHEFQDIFSQKLLFFSWHFSFASVKIWSLIIQYGTNLIINWLNFHTSQPLKNSYNHYQKCALHYIIQQQSTSIFEIDSKEKLEKQNNWGQIGNIGMTKQKLEKFCKNHNGWQVCYRFLKICWWTAICHPAGN